LNFELLKVTTSKFMITFSCNFIISRYVSNCTFGIGLLQRCFGCLYRTSNDDGTTQSSRSVWTPRLEE